MPPVIVPHPKKQREPKEKDDDEPMAPIEIRRDPILHAKYQIEQLIQKVDKPVLIPEKAQPDSIAPPPDIVRNVQGAATGAGSGDFHIYRSLRRKEYARTKLMSELSEKECADEEHRLKVEARRLEEEEKTAKRREKRKRRKQKQGSTKKSKTDSDTIAQAEQSDASSHVEN